MPSDKCKELRERQGTVMGRWENEIWGSQVCSDHRGCWGKWAVMPTIPSLMPCISPSWSLYLLQNPQTEVKCCTLPWTGVGLPALLKYKTGWRLWREELVKTKWNKSNSQKCFPWQGFQRQKSYLFTATEPFFICRVTLENMIETLTHWNLCSAKCWRLF